MASVYQIAKLTNQANALLKYYQLFLENVDLQKHFLYETVSKEVPFPISSITIKRWVLDFEKNDGQFSESKQGKFERRWILNQEDLKNKAIQFIQDFPEINK